MATQIEEIIFDSDPIELGGDSWPHCKNKSDMQRLIKENYLSEKDLYVELPESLSGKKPARQSDHERIFIRAIGLVNQDIAMANTIYQSAVEKASGRGCRTDL